MTFNEDLSDGPSTFYTDTFLPEALFLTDAQRLNK